MKKKTLRLQPAVKTQMKLSTRYLVAGSVLLIVSVIGIILYLNLADNQNAQAGTTDPAGNAPSPNVQQTLTVSLQTTTGQELLQQQEVVSDKAVAITLPKDLPAGLYLMKVKGGREAQNQTISIKLASSK